MENIEPKLVQKMVAVLAAVKGIPKTGYNAKFNYYYMTADDIMTHLRDILSANGLAMFSEMSGDPVVTELQSDKGGRSFHVIARFTFTLLCQDTGPAIRGDWYGEAIDSFDKAVNKAATAALKYWLMKTFLLTTGDEEQDTEWTGSVLDIDEPFKDAEQVAFWVKAMVKAISDPKFTEASARTILQIQKFSEVRSIRDATRTIQSWYAEKAK